MRYLKIFREFVEVKISDKISNMTKNPTENRVSIDQRGVYHIKGWLIY